MGMQTQRWASVSQVRITRSLSPLVTATGRGCRCRDAETCMSALVRWALILSREMHDEIKAQGVGDVSRGHSVSEDENLGDPVLPPECCPYLNFCFFFYLGPENRYSQQL